jgi:hypothetical protein
VFFVVSIPGYTVARAMLRPVIDQLTSHCLDGRRDTTELAAAAVGLYEILLNKLSPLLGDAGSQALFRRSVKLSQEAFPCYREAQSAPNDPLLGLVGECLRKQELELARKASVGLLLVFVELLATFIGERLTGQLLQESWPDVLSFPSQEKPQ